MAECKIPVRIDGYKCVEDMAQAVLNYTYKGKTLKEWADSISEPQTNAGRIRAMTDEELAEFIGGDPMHDICPNNCHEDLDRPCKVCALDWLKQETKE